MIWKPLQLLDNGTIAYRESGEVLPLRPGSGAASYKILGQRGRIHSIWEGMESAGITKSGLGPTKVAQLYGLRITQEAVAFLRGTSTTGGAEADLAKAEFLGATEPA